MFGQTIDENFAGPKKIIPDAIYKKYEGAPHGLIYTYRKQLNQDLIDFCRADVAANASAATAQRRVSM